ncbi:MAG: AAA family ATPase [Pseudomonadota bacterium]|nr:AAA family ATPase [Pseudomonadota bacterium]
MRIQQLLLLRYGKFTDQPLVFPHAKQDFHLIVGANEAGKSTTRSAILDLLYGIETRSTFDFLHAKAEMRLEASIEHQGATLDFIRTKARTKSLLGPTGAVLADSALASFLAGTDRAFFDQMFGLDHARLEAGGNAILSASNDIGQILFQSAAASAAWALYVTSSRPRPTSSGHAGARAIGLTTPPAMNWPAPKPP